MNILIIRTSSKSVSCSEIALSTHRIFESCQNDIKWLVQPIWLLIPIDFKHVNFFFFFLPLKLHLKMRVIREKKKTTKRMSILLMATIQRDTYVIDSCILFYVHCLSVSWNNMQIITNENRKPKSIWPNENQQFEMFMPCFCCCCCRLSIDLMNAFRPLDLWT